MGSLSNELFDFGLYYHAIIVRATNEIQCIVASNPMKCKKQIYLLHNGFISLYKHHIELLHKQAHIHKLK